MADEWDHAGPAVTYEVWRSGPSERARDVRLFAERTTTASVRDALFICEEDKAAHYPDADIKFYVVRVVKTRMRLELDELVDE